MPDLLFEERSLLCYYGKKYTALPIWEKFFRAKNLLDAQNIAYKTNTTNNNLRLSMNNFTGSSVARSRDGSVKDFYEVLVEEKDEARARVILSRETDEA